jgi:hypothetical protein
VQTLRLDGRTAKLMGLASLRGASASEVSIATKQMRLRRAGSARITLRIERRISKRLRGLRQAGGWLETSAKDQHHLTTIIRQQFKLRR